MNALESLESRRMLADASNVMIEAGVHRLLQFDLVTTRVYNTTATSLANSAKTIWLLNGNIAGDVSGTAGDDHIVVSGGAANGISVTINDVTRTWVGSSLFIDTRRGNDVIDLSGLTDALGLSITVYGGAGDDTIVGSLAGEKIFAGDGNDIVSGGNGRDTVYAEAGDDSVRGNAHADLIDGGDGADTLRGDDGADNLCGGANSDRLRGSAGADTLKGGGSRDFLAGEDGDDALYGESGDDFCSGGEGIDYLDGGTGLDAFRGGVGNDNFNDRGPGEDSDFEAGHDQDLVHFTPIDMGSISGGWYGSGGSGVNYGSITGDDYFFIDSNVINSLRSGNVFNVRG